MHMADWYLKSLVVLAQISQEGFSKTLISHISHEFQAALQKLKLYQTKWALIFKSSVFVILKSTSLEEK